MKLLEQLMELGLSEELAKKVSSQVVDGNFIPKARFNEVNEENKALKKSVSERDEQLVELQKSGGDAEELKKQIAALQEQNSQQVKAHLEEVLQMKIDREIEAALTAAGAKNLKAAKALLDMEGIKPGDDGSVTGIKEQIDKLAASEDSKFLFNASEQGQSFKGFQPGGSSAVPNSAQAGFETRLADARKTGNTLEVIKIKQEAAAEGVVLL